MIAAVAAPSSVSGIPRGSHVGHTEAGPEGSRSLRLAGILEGLSEASVDGPRDVEASGIAYDSRRVGPGDVFVAVRGEQLDGNRFAREAIRRGATAVVSASRRPEGLTGATWIQVPDERRAMARMAAELHRHPDREIPVVGITGTNGKTTTAYLLESILAQAGGRPGIVGTVSYRWPGHEEAAGRTTPESADLYHLMRRMVDAGGTEAILEVSSHALSLGRVEGMEFRVAVFTNGQGDTVHVAPAGGDGGDQCR